MAQVEGEHVVPRTQELEDEVVPRVGSKLYTQKEYWEMRFGKEDGYEWLASFPDIASIVEQFVHKTDKILLVGCGNSRLPVDMAEAGYQNIVATDYSETVIDRMKSRYGHAGPSTSTAGLDPQVASARAAGGSHDCTQATHGNEVASRITWEVQDMTCLTYPDGYFDAVIDKAAMDAIIADGCDTWQPPPPLLRVAHSVCCNTARVLKQGGVYMQLSFSQPHFRKKYLLQQRDAAFIDDGTACGQERGVSGAAGQGADSLPTVPATSSQQLPPPSMPERIERGTAGSDDDDEWEADANPDLTPQIADDAHSSALAASAASTKLASSAASGTAAGSSSTAGTFWSTFETITVPLGLGYYMYVMHT